ncbi:unnamed protein product [Somion occarium]
MAQPRRATIDLSKATTISALGQAKTELTVTIRPGHDPTLEPISFLTRNTHGLRAVLAECKRLKELSDANSEPGVIPPFIWIIPYISNRLPEILSPIPPDLRHAHRPLHTLLSPATAGQPGDEALDISLICEEWIKMRAYDLIASSPRSPLRIRVGTFNVNGKLPSQDLSPWVGGRSRPSHVIPPLKDLSPLSMSEATSASGDYFEGKVEQTDSMSVATRTTTSGASDVNTSTAFFTQSSASPSRIMFSSSATISGDPEVPDLLVLAFQELDLSTEALLYSTKTTREEAWCTAALAGLGEKAVGYQKLISKQLVGMLIIIIVRKEIANCFGEMKTTSVGAGILGLMGNKGATAIRLVFNPPLPEPTSSSTSAQPFLPAPHTLRPVVLTFVNSHLAAFDEICYNTTGWLPTNHHPVNGVSVRCPILDDLNYRINLPDADVRTLLAEEPKLESLSLLQQYDQLKLAMRTNKAFNDFSEHTITHSPSYRFSSGVLADDLGYDTKRKPAWTDRVLHMCSAVVEANQISYSSHPEITMSDHKPVSSDILLHVPVVKSEKLESYVRSLWRDVMDFENSEEIPRIKLTSSALDFGKIFYKRSAVQSLELENVGKVSCAFRFVPITNEAPIHPDWLNIKPMSGLMRPGEKLFITLTANVENIVARRLNAGSGRLDDTLILHTSLGKDHFISISGQYQRTCFATSLERLVRLSGPARSAEGDSALLPEEDAMNAPQEVMKLVNWLMSNATEIKNLFLSPGDPALVADIRECLDTGVELTQPSTCDMERVALAVATCLLELLESLPQPVIPVTLQSRCARVSSRDEAFGILDELPSASVNVWISVTAFLHFISQQNPTNTQPLDVRRLADTFVSILLRDDLDVVAPISPICKRNFVLFFIAPG